MKGHIDLAALNQSTRPKKKTKEEKRKEREEKNRQAGGDRSRQGGTGQNASEGKKKRVRIGKERVDVNAVAGQQNGKKRDNAPGANQQGGGKHNKNKNRQQPVIKAEEMCIRDRYYPTDTCFWIKDCQDRFVRFVMVFPPLPKKVKTVDFFIPSSASRFNFDGSEKRESGLRVEDLRPKHRIPQGEVIR